jgi:predicted ester cyclase
MCHKLLYKGVNASPSTLFECLNEHDLSGMLPFAAEDEFQDLPMVGHLEGRDTVFEHFAAVITALPDIHFDIEQIVGEGETVFVAWRLTGTFSGAPFYGMEATGRPIDVRGMDKFTVREGKVASVFAAYDSMDFDIQARPTSRHSVSRSMFDGPCDQRDDGAASASRS